MRKESTIICLIIILFLNTNVQSFHVDESIPASELIESNDSIVSDWMQELQEHEPIEIFSDADFVDQGWLGNGSESNPFIIEGIRIRAEYSSIFIWNTTKHFEIRRCLFTTIEDPIGGGPALSFRNVTNGYVTGCFINETNYGISVRNSTDCQITDNIVSGSIYDAIIFEGGLGFLIANNTIHDTGSGILMMETTDFTIRDNRIYDCSRGLYLTDVQSCNILGNTIWKNSHGVDLTIGHGIITNNTIYGNTGIGIRIDAGLASNMVYGNRIGWNDVQNAVDNSNSTGWDDGLGIGNSWSDYNGTGQYPVPGSSVSHDSWPLILVDNTFPIVDSPLDVDFEFGYSQSLTFNVSDEFPLYYRIHFNALPIETRTWTGQPVSVLLDNRQPGSLVVEIFVWDAQGNREHGIVHVLVAEAEHPTIDHPPDIEYVAGDSGYNITWLPQDAYPDYYEIFINETLYESGNWVRNGSEIMVFVDGYDIGVHNFTIVVYDMVGQTTTDSVFVRVLTPPSGTSPPPSTQPLDYFRIAQIIVSVVSIVVIIAAVLRIYRHKKTSLEDDILSDETQLDETNPEDSITD
ncbi:MAG: right-handed parallel beta-helix repeat-containing protein [Candidatus Thorarchaeota archaeon]